MSFLDNLLRLLRRFCWGHLDTVDRKFLVCVSLRIEEKLDSRALDVTGPAEYVVKYIFRMIKQGFYGLSFCCCQGIARGGSA